MAAVEEVAVVVAATLATTIVATSHIKHMRNASHRPRTAEHVSTSHTRCVNSSRSTTALTSVLEQLVDAVPLVEKCAGVWLWATFKALSLVDTHSRLVRQRKQLSDTALALAPKKIQR